MGKNRSNHDDLASYFLRASGVATIWIDEGGHIGAADVATINDQPGRIVYTPITRVPRLTTRLLAKSARGHAKSTTAQPNAGCEFKDEDNTFE